ncbi:ATP-binding cassette domain-containing protein [Nostocales cyanobacterium LEGE 11386]|nr:ATP-binding cassette domain-containing protein [Nostocales cyanobacterium LEGE 11386]
MQTLQLTAHTNPIQQCTVEQPPFTIGSDPDNDLVISDKGVDSFHAAILWVQSQYWLFDVGSSSGTRIGSTLLRHQESAALTDGTLIQVGFIIIEVKISATPASRTHIFAPAAKTQLINKKPESITVRKLRLDAIDLCKSTSPLLGITLIHNISVSFLPREFIVIAGVSGGGKSTLMDTLNGQRRANSGKVLVNGVNLYQHFRAFKHSIGYVPQDDIVHPELTVNEALKYAAQLRLPYATPEIRQQRIQEILEQLQLAQRKHVPIKRLSGGQRKRVSIGVELITKPSLFFLDEATSGLDPGTELQIMELLRELANKGSTIILITHATKNVAIADFVVFLAKGGRLAYFGPPKLAFDYFKVPDFDTIYNKVERQLSPEKWEERFRGSGFYQKFVSDRQKSIPQTKVPPVAPRINYWQQWWVLCRRNLTILLKNKMSLALMLTGAPILGGFNFLLWKSDLLDTKTGSASQAITMLFVTVIMAVMAGSLATMPEIAKETAIYRRERSAGLGVVPYLASKFHLSFLLALYQSTVLLGCMVSAVNIPGSAVTGMYATLFLASFGSMVLGLLVSAIAPNQSVAPLLTILVLVPQVIFGGGILPVSEFKDNGKFLNQLMLTKYPFESLVTLSRLGADVAKDPCWQKTEQQRKALSPQETTVCDCYGKNVFQQCEFPGIGTVERSSVLAGDVYNARQLIGNIHKSYGDIFSINVMISWLQMCVLISAIAILLFLCQSAKG